MSLFLHEDSLSGMTPAHTYASTTDFEAILNDISKDLIPTDTGKVFPTVWESDFEPNELGMRMAGNEVPTFKFRTGQRPADSRYYGQFGGIMNDNKKW